MMFRCFAFAVLTTLATAATAAMPATPTLKVKTLDGATFDLAGHRGHWVIVNFWATWCSPCIKEMPELSAFDAAHDTIDAVGLAFEDADVATLKAFLAKHPVAYPIARVDPMSPPADFDPPRGLPTTYVIAPDGRVAKKFVGPVTTHDLAKVIGIKP